MTRMGVTSATLAGAFLASAALACPLDAIEAHLARADEHLFWTDFWTDTDDGEAGRELEYAIDDLRHANALGSVDTCGDSLISQRTIQIARRRLAVCLHQRAMTDVHKLDEQHVRGDR